MIQFNPAVTVSLVLAEVLEPRLMIPNILSQMAGSTLAAFIVMFLKYVLQPMSRFRTKFLTKEGQLVPV